MRSSGEGKSLSTVERTDNLDYNLMIGANGETSDCYRW